MVGACSYRAPVMPGLGPGIHDLLTLVRAKDVDGRVKPGHDGEFTHHPSSILYLRKIPSSLNAILRSLARYVLMFGRAAMRSRRSTRPGISLSNAFMRFGKA